MNKNIKKTIAITRATDSTSSTTTSSTSNLSTSLKEGWQQISGIWYFI